LRFGRHAGRQPSDMAMGSRSITGKELSKLEAKKRREEEERQAQLEAEKAAELARLAAEEEERQRQLELERQRQRELLRLEATACAHNIIEQVSAARILIPPHPVIASQGSLNSPQALRAIVLTDIRCAVRLCCFSIL
jgi:hypothetical protein